MHRYFPLEQPIEIKTVSSDMVSLDFREGGIVAHFAIPQDEHRLIRVAASLRSHLIELLQYDNHPPWLGRVTRPSMCSWTSTGRCSSWTREAAIGYGSW